MTLIEVGALSRGFLELAFGVVIRSTVLALLCAGAAWLLRGRTAELRFFLWRWLLLALLVLPVLISVAPPLKRASAALVHAEMVMLPAHPVGSVTVGPLQPGVRARITPAGKPIFWKLWPLALYFGVMFLLFARLFVAVRRLAAIARHSESIADFDFEELARELWLLSGARLKPRIAVSQEVSVPLTFDPIAFDLDEPYILLPESWRTWDQTKLRAVLTHEMIHVRRRDSVTFLAASVAICLFWFHPLSWFLRKRLCTLAEEACDESTLALTSTPEQYAEMLIDFAQEVAAHRRRVIASSAAVVQNSHIKKRIERLFIDSALLRKGRRVTAALITALFLPAIYLSAAARFDAPVQQNDRAISDAANYWNQAALLTAEDSSQLQSTLRQNPDDVEVRAKLLVYSQLHQQTSEFVEQLLWFIEHRPSSSILRMTPGIFSPKHSLLETDLGQITAAWEEALLRSPKSPSVVFNAAIFLERTNPERALELFNGLHDPHLTDRMVAGIYAAAELKKLAPDSKARLNNIDMPAELATQLSDELENSGNPDRLSEVGQILVQQNPLKSEQSGLGLALMQQAIDLDPGNQAWKDALDYAKAEPVRRENYRELVHQH